MPCDEADLAADVLTLRELFHCPKTALVINRKERKERIEKNL